jgi:hypothetical protein
MKVGPSEIADRGVCFIYVVLLGQELYKVMSGGIIICEEFSSFNLVDPASSHMLVSKIKPCTSKYTLLLGETANGSLQQL